MLLKKKKKAIQIIAEKDCCCSDIFFQVFQHFIYCRATSYEKQKDCTDRGSYCRTASFFFSFVFFFHFFSSLLSFGAKWYRLFICIFHFTFRAIVASAEAFHSTKIYNFTPASQQDSFYGQYLIVWWLSF